jgi:hypothetical protein
VGSNCEGSDAGRATATVHEEAPGLKKGLAA